MHTSMYLSHVLVLLDSVGSISELVMPVDKVTKQPKGVAIVTYLMPQHAVTAFNELEGTHFQVLTTHCCWQKLNKGPSANFFIFQEKDMPIWGREGQDCARCKIEDCVQYLSAYDVIH